MSEPATELITASLTSKCPWSTRFRVTDLYGERRIGAPHFEAKDYIDLMFVALRLAVH